MAWEREYHHINLDEAEHRIVLINRAASTIAAQPTRYVIQIQMGAPEFSYTIGHNELKIKLGGDFAISPDGTLKDKEGNVFDPRDFEKKLTAALDVHHELLRAYGRKHGTPEMKGRPNARM